MERQSEQHEAGLSGLLGTGALARVAEKIGDRRATISCLALDGRTATLWLRDGRLCDVESEGHTGVRGLVRALALSEGSFEVRIEPNDVPHHFDGPVRATFEAHQPKADEWRTHVDFLGGIESLYEVNFAAVTQRLGEIPDAANDLLRLIDGHRVLQVLLDIAPQEHELESLRLLRRLRELGVINRTEVTPPASWVPSEPVIPLIEAVPLPDSFDITEVTFPSMRIPVHRFPPKYGERRRRLEQEQAGLLQQLSEKNDRPVLLTHELFAPGAVMPSDIDERLPALMASMEDTPRLSGSDRRWAAWFVGFVVLGAAVGLMVWRWSSVG